MRKTMNEEYIKRSLALECADWQEHEFCECEDAIRALADDLKNIPAEDVRRVVHGKNIGKDYAECDQFVCSKCGIELQGWYQVERDEDDGDETHREYVFRFCPNCGADVREVQTDG